MPIPSIILDRRKYQALQAPRHTAAILHRLSVVDDQRNLKVRKFIGINIGAS
jgi:hypothetical protein